MSCATRFPEDVSFSFSFSDGGYSVRVEVDALFHAVRVEGTHAGYAKYYSYLCRTPKPNALMRRLVTRAFALHAGGDGGLNGFLGGGARFPPREEQTETHEREAHHQETRFVRVPRERQARHD